MFVKVKAVDHIDVRVLFRRFAAALLGVLSFVEPFAVMAVPIKRSDIVTEKFPEDFLKRLTSFKRLTRLNKLRVIYASTLASQ